jgi:uncharacterized protein YoxC
VSLDTLAKADIFFFVTTIAVVLVALGFVTLAYYGVRTLEQARRALKEVEEHIGDTTDDVKDILFDIRESAAYRFLFKKKRRLK